MQRSRFVTTGPGREPDSDLPEPPRDSLRSCDSESLLRTVEASRGELSLREALDALRNPYSDSATVEALCSEVKRFRSLEFRRELVRHPKCPWLQAAALLPGLPWRDLMTLGREVRVAPRIRRLASQLVLERLPQLTLGERISLARLASPEVLNRLRHDSEPRVVAAMLANPRTTEATLVGLVSHPRASPEALKLVATTPRWAGRYEIRRALVRNPRTPRPVVYRVVRTLKRMDWQSLARDPKLTPALRELAQQLLDGKARTL